MAFDEVRFNVNISLNAVGGLGFETDITPLTSGHEQRNKVWEEFRGEWEVDLPAMSPSDLESDLAFFYARNGRWRGFRFKDWSDYTLVRQSIGTGDGADVTWQIYKRYTSSINYDRDLTKIVAASVSVWVNSSLMTEGGGADYTLDYDTGIITFNTVSPVVPGSSDDIEVACEFDVPVRFDMDKPNVRMIEPALAEWRNIRIVETRDIA